MKLSIFSIALALGLFACSEGTKQVEEKIIIEKEIHEHGDKDIHSHEGDSTKKKVLSPKTSIMTNIGDNHIHINYGAPSKRDRVIFGGLVAYNQVWATGAHKCTNIEFEKDVIINELKVPAGKYGFFTIPGQEKWTIALSKDWDMHMQDDYVQENDILRIETAVQKLDSVQEKLKFDIEAKDNNQGTISLSWDVVKISFDLKNA